MAEPAADSPQPRATPARRLLPYLLPIASLAFGLTSAALAEQSPRRAAIVAGIALAGLVGVALRSLLQRARPGRLGTLSRLSGAWLAQSAVQTPLLFALPFFVRAIAAPLHAPLVTLLALATVAASWDPWFSRLAARPLVLAALQALAAFAGFSAALPVLGLSQTTSLALATVAALAALHVAAIVERRAPLRLRLGAALGATAAIGLLGLGGGARLVPAAPLRVTRVALGTGLRGLSLEGEAARVSSPAELVCHSTLVAPRGVRDRLVHRWTHDGRPADRIEVRVEGSERGAYRTFSRKRQLGASPAGRWRCDVETAAGQWLGAAAIEVVATSGS